MKFRQALPVRMSWNCRGFGHFLPKSTSFEEERNNDSIVPLEHRHRDSRVRHQFVETSREPLILDDLIVGGHSRIRTYDFHRVKVALYR